MRFNILVLVPTIVALASYVQGHSDSHLRRSEIVGELAEISTRGLIDELSSRLEARAGNDDKSPPPSTEYDACKEGIREGKRWHAHAHGSFHACCPTIDKVWCTGVSRYVRHQQQLSPVMRRQDPVTMALPTEALCSRLAFVGLSRARGRDFK
ncbi:hypothetical protein DFP72DRAFT_859523 [Ephemerocybe angulata]|uniref:Uncharacterized protein n=1 Tax=Ephemerocybe angulata TaxID=980116 RepID=A0A8H6HA19_9AGAR|nr:hypothetical protein DFP72DRAFT_859523 [Tulosesus angulatus]